MKLADLLCPWVTTPMADCEISDLQNDSRLLKPGDLFLAYPGSVSDGRSYIQQAITAGVTAIAYDPLELPPTFSLPNQTPCIAIPNLATKLALIASRFFAAPSRALSITGVTGTNGKTTIAYQLAQAHALLGASAAYVGTLGQGDVHHLQPLANTTPEALCLQRLFQGYRQQGIQQVCMEVSSHGLNEHRVAAIDFVGAVYTNLSHEHLDYHHTMDAYAKVKAQLFSMPTLKWAVINHDDAYASLMNQSLVDTCKKYTYGLQAGCDVRALNCQISMSGSDFDVSSPWGSHHVHVQTLGAFNIYNSLAVFTSLLAAGYPVTDVVPVMAKLQASPGRMEVVAASPSVIVDYAHTPDALENVLSTLVQLRAGLSTPAGRLWVVFGCGGDRDKTKRPMMGRIASQYADVMIITSDNPRHEEPQTIATEIAAGTLQTTEQMTIIDRRDAIHHALRMAAKDDIILIAGKGHETYQQIGDQRLVFSDQDVVRAFLDV